MTDTPKDMHTHNDFMERPWRVAVENESTGDKSAFAGEDIPDGIKELIASVPPYRASCWLVVDNDARWILPRQFDLSCLDALQHIADAHNAFIAR